MMTHLLFSLRDMVMKILLDLRHAFGQRYDYFMERKLRLLVLIICLSALITFAVIPVEDLTGTRWAYFAGMLVAIVLARLSSGFELYQYKCAEIDNLMMDEANSNNNSTEWKTVVTDG